jgi:hypothetical protein
MVCMELAGGPANVKDADLNRMYKENKDFEYHLNKVGETSQEPKTDPN